MKRSLSLLFLLGTWCSFNLASQNLIKGGDMEVASQAYWSECGQSTFGDGDGPIWGDTERDYTHATPEFGTGGVLTIGESWGECLYTISQAVTLTANTTYTASLDYTVADYNAAWCRVFIGTTDPASTCPVYFDNQIGDLIKWDVSYGWGDPDFGNYTFKENFTPTTSGTYYFVIQFGTGNPDPATPQGYLNTSIDNVSLVANTPSELIKGGDMEVASQAYWSECGQSTFGDGDGPIWGDTERNYTHATPEFGTGGVLTIGESWGECLYTISQPVTLTANTTYTASMDYTVADYNAAWCRVFIGTTDPASTCPVYFDNQIGDLIKWDVSYGWGDPDFGNYTFKENFTPATSGTYYFVIQFGTGNPDPATPQGYLNTSIDNVSLVVANNSGIKDVNVNNAVVVGGKSFISARFEGMANIAVYSIQGQLIRQAISQNTFRADNLRAGIYLVRVNNKAFKVIVR